MKKLRGSIIVSLFMVAVTLFAACAPKGTVAPPPSATPAPSPSPAPQLSDWDKVLATARQEGTVTIYSTWAVQMRDALQQGMSQYGIKVQTIGGIGGELELKITSEQRAKAYTADLFTGGWTNQVNVTTAGYGQRASVALPSLTQKGVWKIDPAKYEPQSGVYIAGTGITPSVMINTDLVRSGEIQSWQDLLDAKWKDRIVMTDPRTGSGPGASGLGAWMVLGEDFWKKLAPQRITFQVKYDLAVSQLVYGEKSVLLFSGFVPAVSAIRAGAPVKIVHLKEGTTYYLNGINYVKSAPHPNAAMVLLNWYFTREGQAAIAKAIGNYTVRNDLSEDWMVIPELNPKTFTVIEPPNNLDPQLSTKAADFATKVFGAR